MSTSFHSYHHSYHVIEATGTLLNHVPRLLSQVYGNTFVHQEFYQIGQLQRLVHQHQASFLIGLHTETQTCVALLGLLYLQPYPRSLEICVLAISPEVSELTSAALLKLLLPSVQKKLMSLCTQNSLRTFYAESTISHGMVKQLCEYLGFRLAGLFQNSLPPWSQNLTVPRNPLSMGSDTFKRRSTLIFVYSVKITAEPYAVFLPPRYHELLAAIYQRLKSPVRFLKAPEIISLQIQPVSLIDHHTHPLDRKAVLRVQQIGEDWLIHLNTHLETLMAQNLEIIHCELPLSSYDLSPGVALLIQAGFRFGALIPFYHTQDVLILQYIRTPEKDVPEALITHPLDQWIYREILES